MSWPPSTDMNYGTMARMAQRGFYFKADYKPMRLTLSLLYLACVFPCFGQLDYTLQPLDSILFRDSKIRRLTGAFSRLDLMGSSYCPQSAGCMRLE